MTHTDVTVIMTVRNDREGCAQTLDSLLEQTRRPAEIVIVDAGSTDGTRELLASAMKRVPTLRIIDAPGANIARGRNLATQEASFRVIACTDAGCRAEPDWLEKLIAPFENDPSVEFVAGFYRVEPHTLLEKTIGLATMRGQLTPVDPARFNPSGRSMAYRKDLLHRAGGWPEWLHFSEDTLFDHRLRQMNVSWRFAPGAIVHWRPRRSLRALARQFYRYGTGRGHTRIDAASFHYNLRNLAITLSSVLACLVTVWAAPVALASLVYFYWWSLHGLAMRIARHTHRSAAYPLCFVVMWMVQMSNLTGYLVGSWQRIRNRRRFEDTLTEYMGRAATPSERPC